MQVFKSAQEVIADPLSPSVRALTHRLFEEIVEAYKEGGFEFDAEDDGCFIVIEREDSDDAVHALVGYSLRDVAIEGGHYSDCCFVFCTMHNNQYGITWIVPDETWLDPALRQRLVRECAVPGLTP